jgi:hypothetical protein
MNEDSRAEDEEQARPRPRVVDKRVSARPAEPVEPPPAAREEPGTPPQEPGAAPQGPPGTQSEAPPHQEPAAPGPGDEAPSGDVWTPEREEQARRLAEELARAPARDIVVTMAMNFVEVASVKIDAGDLPGAQLAIDAFDGVVGKLGARLGDAEGPLRQMLAQLQMAYAQRATQPPPSADG